jgi:hypothetical protein
MGLSASQDFYRRRLANDITDQACQQFIRIADRFPRKRHNNVPNNEAALIGRAVTFYADQK